MAGKNKLRRRSAAPTATGELRKAEALTAPMENPLATDERFRIRKLPLGTRR
jgi:hypothetical protein